jgi:hypothetical protein
VILFFPFLLSVPLLFGEAVGPLPQVLICVLVLVLIFMAPDWLLLILPKNTVVARKNGNIVQLYLEQDHEIDLSRACEIDVGTGLFPVNKLRIRVKYEDGRYQCIKTRFQMSQLVRFLDRLEPEDKS